MSEYGTPRLTYTVFCRQTNRQGTIWIGNVKASDHRIAGDFNDVKSEAVDACAGDWGWQDRQNDIECIGAIVGDIEIAMWEDE